MVENGKDHSILYEETITTFSLVLEPYTRCPQSTPHDNDTARRNKNVKNKEQREESIAQRIL